MTAVLLPSVIPFLPGNCIMLIDNRLRIALQRYRVGGPSYVIENRSDTQGKRNGIHGLGR